MNNRLRGQEKGSLYWVALLRKEKVGSEQSFEPKDGDSPNAL